MCKSNLRRSVCLLATFAAVAGAFATTAAAAGAPQVVTLTATSASITWTGRTQARVEYGYPGLLDLWSAPSHGGHQVRLRGLLPNTAYEVQLRDGAQLRFRTPTSSVTRSSVSKRGAILLDGSPFIPIMQWLQCPSRFPEEVKLGFNVFLGRGCSNNTDQQEVAALGQLGAYSVLPFDQAVASNPALFGWRFGDEPDLESNAIHPKVIQAQYRANRKADPHHLNFLTVTSGFYSQQSPPEWTNGNRSVYRGYARGTDVIGFDLYSITGWCHPGWLPEVYASQRELIHYAGRRPTYQWIEAASTSSQWCTGRGIRPDELSSEAWQAVIGGAKAIGYFTHSWKPTYSQFRVAKNVQAAMRRTNRELEALTPALLATPLHVQISSSAGQVIALGRRFHDARYLVVANLERQPLKATLQVGQDGNSLFQGFDHSARRLHFSAGKAVLKLAPLAVEILVAQPTGR